MKPSELRLGNYIQDVNGKLEEVESLHCFGGNEINERGCIGKYNPIKLTGEILENLGFKYTDGEDACDCIWSLNGLEIWEHSDGFCHSYSYGGDINYLHELQNFYYVISGGNELTLSKPF